MSDFEKYISEKRGKLFKDLGIIFAFNQAQFDAEKVEGIEYSNLGSGVICPKQNVEVFCTSMRELQKERIDLDLKNNTKRAIILRELWNTEAFYTGDITDAMDALKGYPFTEKEINDVYVVQARTVDTW